MVRYRRAGGGTFETAVTDGFRFEVAALDRVHGGVVAHLGPERTYAWPTWEAPTWHERLKPAYDAMREVWGWEWWRRGTWDCRWGLCWSRIGWQRRGPWPLRPLTGGPTTLPARAPMARSPPDQPK